MRAHSRAPGLNSKPLSSCALGQCPGETSPDSTMAHHGASSCVFSHLGHPHIQKPDQSTLLEQSECVSCSTLLKELELHFWISFLETSMYSSSFVKR